MINRGITRLEARITDASKKDCFFFDPSLEHGGPRPQSQSKLFWNVSDFTVKLGKRRSAWIDNELERIRRQVEENEDLDFFDRYFEAQQKNNGERGFSLDQQFQERLSAEPNLAWKQIGTGFRKWILRYISECNGQATYSYHTSRLAKVHGNVKDAYETVGQADYDGDYGLEESY